MLIFVSEVIINLEIRFKLIIYQVDVKIKRKII